MMISSLAILSVVLSVFHGASAAFKGKPIVPTPNLATDISPYYILDQIAPIIGPLTSVFIVRITFGLSVAWYDAVAPFHPTAVGLYSNLRQANTPTSSISNKNLALLFATRRVLNSLAPGNSFIVDNYLFNVGIDPDGENFNGFISSVDPTTPHGIGNLAGIAVVKSLESDASNQLGKLPQSKYNNVRYRNCTNFVPVNSPYEITDPRFWQPLEISDGKGTITHQTHVAPQIALVDTVSTDYANPAFVSKLSIARASTPENFTANVLPQLKELLLVDSNLNDKTKKQAEFYKDKGLSYIPALKFIGTSKGLSFDDYIFTVFTLSVAVYDAALFSWKNKIRINSVRLITAAKVLYGNNPLPAAWGGVGKGTVLDISGNNWKPYITTPAHTNYPSGSAVYFSAFANTAKLIFGGNDTFGLSRTYATGSSTVEPGITPKAPVTISAPTLTSYEEDGGYARVLGGVHFTEDVTEGKRIGKLIAPYAFAKAQQLIKGGKICQYGGYCRTSADCALGNLCNEQSEYYSQCLPDPTTYAPSSSGCIGNYGAKCSSTSKCCDPGAVCDLSKSYPQCQQPSLNSGLCANPSGF